MRRRAFLRGSSTVVALSGIPATAAVRTQDTSEEIRTEPLEPLGRVEVTGAAEAVVGDDSETAYLATTTGFTTVDISDPFDPELLADRTPLEVDDRRFEDILDVKVDGDRLAVVGPAGPRYGNAFHGIMRYDVSDPVDPVAVGEPYETGYHIHNCFLADDLLYVVANLPDENPLVIFDVNGDEIDEIGRWSLVEHEPEWGRINMVVRYLHDVYVQDEIAYLAHWNAGTVLLDVSDPTDPDYLSHVREIEVEDHEGLTIQEAQQGLPGNDHYSAVDDTGEILAVGREAWTTGGDEPDGPGGIDLFDVSEKTAPEFRASIEPPETDDPGYGGSEWTTSHNFELRNGRLYSSWYQGGIKIHDVSDPAAPEELAHYRDSDEAAFWTARVATPGETFVASSTPQIDGTDIDGALYTFPIGDPDDITDGSESTGDGNGDGATDGNGTDDSSDAPLDSVPGFGGLAGVAGLAGGAATLEWLRRHNGDEQ